MAIPKIIHQIWWQGKNNISERHINYRKTWFKNHPKWNLELWDKNRFEKLLSKLNNSFYNTIYSDLPYMIQKIDFCKYVIIYRFGGVYVDMDTTSERPLDDLLIKYKKGLLLSKLEIYKLINYNLINNGIILATKNHPFFKFLFKNIYLNRHRKFYQNKDWYIMDSTGPLVFTYATLNYLKTVKNIDIKLLEDSYLESCKMSDFGDCPKRGKYITHIHDCSWCSAPLKIHFKLIKFYRKNKFILNLIIVVINLIIFLKYLNK